MKPKAIESSLKAHDENPDAGLVYSNYMTCDENLKDMHIHYGKTLKDKDPYFFNLKSEISHFVSFKKKYYNLTDGIDPKNLRAEDQDIYLKMYEIAPVKYINEVLYRYRLHNSGNSTFNNVKKAFFWHWVAIMKAAERRNINIEDNFLEYFETRYTYNLQKDKLEGLKNSRLLKILNKIGLFRIFNSL